MSAIRKAAVLYHYPCVDGAFAALAAHLFFSATATPVLFFPNAVYNPIRVEDLPLDEIDDVYLLDFVPPGFVQNISSKVGRSGSLSPLFYYLFISLSCSMHTRTRICMCLYIVVVLDHHKTALEILSGSISLGENVKTIIDIEKSGATIAYDYFKNKLLSGADITNNGFRALNGFARAAVPQSESERVENLFKYVEDGDLWRWALKNSNAFSSGMKYLNIEYSIRLNPNVFEQLLALDAQSVISQGLVSLSHNQKLIDAALEQSYEIALVSGKFGHCLAVDADSISELRSELGHQLANKSHGLKLRGIGAIVYRVPELQNDQLLKISLRSVNNEDTTPISQEFGGGGHRSASSFMLSASEFKKWKVLS